MQTGVFVVTGAGSGIGLGISLKLIEEGHLVIGLGRDISKLERAALTFPPDKFQSVAVDLADAESTDQAVVEIRKILKDRGVAGLVNNAGIFERVAFNESKDELWERMFYGNLLSAVRLTRALYPELKRAKGSVLNISSSLGLRPIAMTSGYSALKAAMINWTETLALEWATDRIRVNCLCPGIVDTPIHSFTDAAARAQGDGMQPLGRMGTPADIGEAALFLLFSTWTTGSSLTVDGGISL